MKTLDKALEDIRVSAKAFRLIHCMRGNSSINDKQSTPQFKPLSIYEKIWEECERSIKGRTFKSSKNGFNYTIYNTRVKRPKHWLVEITGMFDSYRYYQFYKAVESWYKLDHSKPHKEIKIKTLQTRHKHFHSYIAAQMYVDSRTKRFPS